MREGILAYLAQQTSRTKPTDKNTFQQLVYFIQEAGVPLGFRYGVSLNGPSSDSLYDFLEGQVYQGILEYKSDDPDIVIMPGPATRLAISEDKQVLRKHARDVRSVLRVLGDLEPEMVDLLSTAHFILTKMELQSEEEVFSAAVRIKGNRFDAPKIREAITELKKLELLGPSGFGDCSNE